MKLMDNSTNQTSAIIYTRVSTKEQVDGASLEAQENECRRCANERLKAKVLGIFVEEGESAKTTNRTQLKAMMDFILENKGNIDYLVIYDVSRISRNVEDFARLRSFLAKNGVELISATEPSIDLTPMGKLTGNLMACFAQFENDQRSAKVQSAMRERARQGYWVTQPPVGFITKTVMPDGSLVDGGHDKRRKYPKILVPDNRNNLAVNLARVMTCFSNGDMTEVAAYEMAVGLGITGAQGAPLTFSRFDVIMRSPVYAGYSNSKNLLDGEMTKLKFDGIIPYSTWERNQFLLNRNKRTFVRRSSGYYPLDGTIICPICGKCLHGDAPRDGSSNHTPRYYCRGGVGRGHNYQSAKADDVHAVFDSFLQQLTPTEGAIRLFKEILKRTAHKKLVDVTAALKKLSEEKESISGKRVAALDSLLEGKINAKEKDEIMMNLEEKLQALEMRRMELEEQKQLNEATIEYVLNFIDKPAKLWRDADLESKKAFQQMLFPNGLHIDIKEKKCRTEDLGPLYSVMDNKKEPEGSNSDNLVISAGVEPALSG